MGWRTFRIRKPIDPRAVGRRVLRILASLAAVTAITVIFRSLPDINETTVALVLSLAVLVAAVRWGLAESLLVALAALLSLDYFFVPPVGTLDVSDPENWVSLGAFVLTALVAGRLAAREQRERRRAEDLLRNILPSEVAVELQARGEVVPRYSEDVTILFTDFVGFTLATEKLAAEDLVHLLHGYFTEFDQIADRYGLEKLKTIGDSYMCVGGLPARNPAHPVDALMAAFEMLDAVRKRDVPGAPARWRVRIGIHTGPVIAGVVGIHKFAYDVWGDTVNHSSRMESSSAPNRINISERTYARVKDFFECEYRGRLPTKDKKEVEMYFASGLLPSLTDETGQAPPEKFARRYHGYFQHDPPAFPECLAVCEESKRRAPIEAAPAPAQGGP